MKKITSFLCSFLVLISLVGCGTKEGENIEEKITFNSTYTYKNTILNSTTLSKDLSELEKTSTTEIGTLSPIILSTNYSINIEELEFKIDYYLDYNLRVNIFENTNGELLSSQDFTPSSGDTITFKYDGSGITENTKEVRIIIGCIDSSGNWITTTVTSDYNQLPDKTIPFGWGVHSLKYNLSK